MIAVLYLKKKLLIWNNHINLKNTSNAWVNIPNGRKQLIKSWNRFVNSLSKQESETIWYARALAVQVTLYPIRFKADP